MKKINQKDIASSLNISRVTVTKALKDHPDIAEKTKLLVKKKAIEMGYIPNFIGRSLSSRKTQTIGIILPKIAHSFFAYSIEKFYQAAREKGYHIIPMVSFEDEDIELENIQTLLSMRVDGIIIDIAGNTSRESNYELINRAGCQMLFYDRGPRNYACTTIATNDEESAYNMTKLIIDKGYKKIYHFAGLPALSIAAERQKGYEKAMDEAGMLKHILKVDLKNQSGYDALLKCAENNEIPDAIFAVNDSVAHGIYRAAAELGLKIPDHIAVAGFGDIESSQLLSPPLTSVKIPVADMTKAAIDKIITMIEENNEVNETHVFESKLIERKSI